MPVSIKLKASVVLASALAAIVGGDVQANAVADISASPQPDLTPAPSNNPIVTWENRKSPGWYLTVRDGGTHNGDKIAITRGDRERQQHWTMKSLHEYVQGYLQYDAVNRNSGKCLARPTTNVNHAGEQLVQHKCGRNSSYPWGEVSVRASDHGTQGRRLGWLLWQVISTGPTHGVLACENFNKRSVYSKSAVHVLVSPSKYPRCIWH